MGCPRPHAPLGVPSIVFTGALQCPPHTVQHLKRFAPAELPDPFFSVSISYLVHLFRWLFCHILRAQRR